MFSIAVIVSYSYYELQLPSPRIVSYRDDKWVLLFVIQRDSPVANRDKTFHEPALSTIFSG